MSDVRKLRGDEQMINSLLERAKKNHETSGQKHRKNERFEFGLRTLVVDFPSPMGATRYNIPARDISREGISFLIGNFVYPGSICQIRLVSEYNQSMSVEGIVTRCRYLSGSTNIYDVGVRLRQPIDVAMFHRAAAQLRVLLADDDEAMSRLVAHFLSGTNCELKSVSNGKDALAEVAQGTFDLILLDVDLPELDGVNTARELRKRNYFGPIIACTASGAAETRAKCLEAGCTDFLEKPFRRDQLIAIIEAQKTEPIVSTMVQDRNMAPLIDEFVAGIPARLSELTNCFAKEELESMERLARQLKGQAGSYGFDVITEAAGHLERTANAKAELAQVRNALNDLMRLCLAARPATCTES